MFLAMACLAAAPAVAGGDLRLRGAISVEGSEITLGDLFDNTGEKAAVPVAIAPEPGRNAYLRVNAVRRLLRRHSLTWQGAGALSRIKVKRASQTVPRDEITDVIRVALEEHVDMIDHEFDIVGQQPTLLIAVGADPSVQLENLSVDRVKGRFSVVLTAPADDPTVRLALRGRLYRVTEVPVLVRRVAANDVIREADVDYVRLRTDRVGRNMITDSGDLIGMSSRRSLAPGRAIRRGDVQIPVLVAKGSAVTMTYRQGNLTLNAAGRAMQSGGQNEQVTVVNLRSHQTVTAVVTGPGQVTVAAIKRLVLSRATK
jgi:flagella basal body P-ring formation protein FlgA